MIKLFRKIRQQLIQENQMGKYFKYAIGEIILVVIGILIALQINNWNENRKSQQAKRIYIDRLINDLKSDSLAFSLNIKSVQSTIKNAKHIMSVVENKQPITNNKVFVLNLQRVGRYKIEKIRNNTFLDLQNSGNLILFSNDSIVNAIRNYYFNEIELWNTLYVNRVSEGFLPIVTDILPFSISESVMISEKIQGIEINFNQDYEKYDLSVSDTDIDLILKKIKNHDTFNFHLKNATRAHMLNMSSDQYQIKRASVLIELLRKLKT